MRRIHLIGLVFIMWCGPVAAGPARPELTLALGERNEGVGLRVPSGGDGENVPAMVEGVAARRVAGERSLYLYVAVDRKSVV